MSALRIAIVGIGGRMGQEITALAKESGVTVAGGVSPVAVSGLAELKVVAELSALSSATFDVLIDFSLPEATDAVIAWAVKNKKPLVSGVTGISEAQKQAFKNAGREIPVFWAPNMSLGVAVLARTLGILSFLDGFDFQIEELHHIRKKDKPSGTALLLQERLQKAVKGTVPAPVAIRGGGIFGIHRVFAMGEEETLTFEHSAMNRRVFARGALKAAAWLIAKPAGYYSMDDVLG